jgi:Tfp pilus assembly protein PilO
VLKGRRAPVLVGVVAFVLALLLIFFLVLPKMHSVDEAQTTLDTTRSQRTVLQSQLEALRQAQADAPKNKQAIEDVQTQIPPTADLPGIIRLMQGAATDAGIILSTMTPSTPVFNDATGLSEITVSYTVTGTYFALTEYLYNLETLPRAAKTTDVTINVSSSGAAATTSTIPDLSMTGSVILYTTDTSAGPGSEPGPTSASGSSSSSTSVPTSPAPGA